MRRLLNLARDLNWFAILGLALAVAGIVVAIVLPAALSLVVALVGSGLVLVILSTRV